MATVRVQPLPDGVDQRSSWQVKKNGRRVSTHVKKSAAERKARRVANAGDSVVVHGTNGQVVQESTRTPGRGGGGSKDKGLLGRVMDEDPMLGEDDTDKSLGDLL